MKSFFFIIFIFSIFTPNLVNAKKIHPCIITLREIMEAEIMEEKGAEAACKAGLDNLRKCAGYFLDQNNEGAAIKTLQYIKQAEVAIFEGKCPTPANFKSGSKKRLPPRKHSNSTETTF